MKNLQDVVALCVDHGRFVHIARTLGRAYGKTYYTSPEERDCPLLREASVGTGFDEIQRVKSIWEVVGEIDVAIFFDIGFEAEQRVLRTLDIPVWGAGDAGELESDKGMFLDSLIETDLPVPKYHSIKGLTNLRLYLANKEDLYIKVSKFRGDWETMHWTSMDEMDGVLDSYAVRFGPLKETIDFFVFEPIETEVEDGVDTWRVNGQWPEMVLHGTEMKDKSYLGGMQLFEDLPEEVRCVNELFGPVLDKFNAGGAMKFSTEVRITGDGESFFNDATCRFGSPPSQSECHLIKNLPEIIYRGALGECVEPEFEDRYVVQAFLTVDGDRDEWKSIKVDEEMDEHIKGGFCCKMVDLLCLSPITEYHSSEVGYLVHSGSTPLEAIENLRDLKDQLPSCLKCEFNSLADLLKEMKAAEEQGTPAIEAEVPDPKVIVSG